MNTARPHFEEVFIFSLNPDPHAYDIQINGLNMVLKDFQLWPPHIFSLYLPMHSLEFTQDYLLAPTQMMKKMDTM